MFSPGHLLYNYFTLIQFDLHKRILSQKLRSHKKFFSGTLLDVGAGEAPYKNCFPGILRYDTTNSISYYSGKVPDDVKSATTFWTRDDNLLPVDESTYETVVCFQVLSLIDNPNQFLTEIFRVLKPGGVFALSTDYLYPSWNEKDRIRRSACGLRELAENNGFEVLNIESFGAYRSMKYSIAMRYIRSYPSLHFQKSQLLKGIGLPVYFLQLILLPLYSIYGYLIYLSERNITDAYAYTFNYFMICRKK